MKTAFLFPGQGAQYVGMGQDLCKAYPEAREVFKEGSDALGIDLEDLCFRGPEERLMETENTQPAILATSVAAARVLQTHGIRPGVMGGLSVGEYSALVIAGSLSLRDTFVVVKERGRLMQEAVPQGEGAMAAVMGLSRQEVEDACREAGEYGVVGAANYNCPGQVVISGDTKAVDEAVEAAKRRGARRVVKLSVSAPFHSSLMEPAGERLRGVLAGVMVSDPVLSVVSNVGATYLRDAHDVRERLVRQVSSPVLWEDCVRQMAGDGAGVFLEVGPGNALTGFMKRILPGATACSVQDVDTLGKALECCRGVC